MMFHENGPDRPDIAWKKAEPAEGDLLLYIRGGRVCLRDDGDTVALPRVGEDGAAPGETVYLFSVSGRVLFLAAGGTAPRGLTEIAPRELRYRKPMHIAFAATLGWRLAEWYAASAYCGRCGAKNEPSGTERAMVCPACGNTVYPAIAPSVIVLIRNGEKALLTRYQAAHSAYRRYALVAGYTESGETPEETVHREVAEEVGLRVRNVTYYKSQPWPLSGALLLGFVCDVDGDDAVRVDPDELECAEWIDRSDMPDRSEDVSLTSEMMEQFRLGRL